MYSIWESNLHNKFSGSFDHALSKSVPGPPAFCFFDSLDDESEEGSDGPKGLKCR